MRHIDADALISELGLDFDTGESYDEKTLRDFIDNAPTIDAEPVRHGKWIDGDPINWECSECGYLVMRYNNTPFCPNCGANMREN